MTAKAFNSRVIAAWLHDCATHAHERSFPADPDRTFGKWLEHQVASGIRMHPADDRLLHQKLALTLGHLFRKNVFLLWLTLAHHFL